MNVCGLGDWLIETDSLFSRAYDVSLDISDD